MPYISVLSGLFVGPLIRKYSYRKVALVGSALSAIGLIATFPAENVAHIIAAYSIVGGKCLDTSCVNPDLYYICSTVRIFCKYPLLLRITGLDNDVNGFRNLYLSHYCVKLIH